MRFAWLRENAGDKDAVQQGCTNPLAMIRTAYNLTFWIFLFPFFTSMAYATGFILFAVVILVRLLLNLYTNLAFKEPGQYESFPFRIPS